MSAVADPEPAPGADEPRLRCDFCREAGFEAEEEKVAHERQCEAARVTVRLPRQPNASVGFKIHYGTAIPSVSRDSIASRDVFSLVEKIRALANAIFSPEPYDWATLDDTTLDAVLGFGRKYWPHDQNFNEGTLKAALQLLLKPGDAIESVQYTVRTGENNRLWLHDKQHRDVNILIRIFPDRSNSVSISSYPMELFIKRIPPANEVKRSFDPLQSTRKLDLSDNFLVQPDFSGLVNRLCQFKVLKELNLDGNAIGRAGCRALMALLREGSPLQWLSLENNLVDDECVAMIVEALENNTTLTTLDLNRNRGITGRGQDQLFDLIGDRDDTIDDAYLSNHALECLSWEYVDSDYYNASDVSLHLMTLLGINGSRDRYDPGRQKVWYRYFSCINQDLEPFLDLDVAVVPHLLAWVAMINDSEGKPRFSAEFRDVGEHLQHVHRIVRDWNVPALFGCLSADRARILELEELVLTLKAENGKLRKELEVKDQEIRVLSDENCALKGEGTDGPKRKREKN